MNQMIKLEGKLEDTVESVLRLYKKILSFGIQEAFNCPTSNELKSILDQLNDIENTMSSLFEQLLVLRIDLLRMAQYKPYIYEQMSRFGEEVGWEGTMASSYFREIKRKISEKEDVFNNYTFDYVKYLFRKIKSRISKDKSLPEAFKKVWAPFFDEFNRICNEVKMWLASERNKCETIKPSIIKSLRMRVLPASPELLGMIEAGKMDTQELDKILQEYKSPKLLRR